MNSDAQIQRLHVPVLLQMLADLGLSVYVEDFEKPFLTATSEFYMVSSAYCKCSPALHDVRICAGRVWPCTLAGWQQGSKA